MKMKKLIALLLSAAMVFALCACGQQPAAPATDAPFAAPAPAPEGESTDDLPF